MRRISVLLVVVLTVVLAGCGAFPPSEDTEYADGEIGVVDGVTAGQELSITVDDGLNESELNTLVTRSMARIEVLRKLDFNRTVAVEIISREEYRNDRVFQQPDRNSSLWNNQVWEGLFLVGEDRNVTQVRNRTYSTAVQGYYSPSDEQIVIVSDSDTPTVDPETLVHELVHALQDQRFGLDESPDTQDRQLARNGVVEGEANLVTQLYRNRCNSEWSCISPDVASDDSDLSVDRGLYRIIIHPYQQGPNFVAQLRERGGWELINTLHESYPTSTEQIIHPEAYPGETPDNVTVADRSGEDWSRFEHEPVGETLGEAGIFSMLLQNGAIDAQAPFRYNHPVSAGWGGDTLVPYHSDYEEFGYVWKIEWDSEGDATAFYETYLELLEAWGAQERGRHGFVIDEGSFADAFRVTLDGTTVRIVNGPSFESLSAIGGSHSS